MKIAIFTGTARPHGIGRASAMGLINRGYSVLGVDVLELQGPFVGSDTAPSPTFYHHHRRGGGGGRVARLPGRLRMHGP